MLEEHRQDADVQYHVWAIDDQLRALNIQR
jgi:hypothetical protein